MVTVIIPKASLKVTEMLITNDVLIGMDIISQGDFVITASQGKTKFSFQIPSTHDTDYAKESKLPENNPIHSQ